MHEPPPKRAKYNGVRAKQTSKSSSEGIRRTGTHAAEPNLFDPIKDFAQTWNCHINKSTLTCLTASAKLVYRSKLGGASYWLSHRDCFTNKDILPLENIVRRIYCTFVAPHDSNAGCEWWVQVRPDDDKATNQQDREAVRFHFDKDEEKLVSHNRSASLLSIVRLVNVEQARLGHIYQLLRPRHIHMERPGG